MIKKTFLIQIKGENEESFSKPVLINRARLRKAQKEPVTIFDVSRTLYCISIDFFDWLGYYELLRIRANSLSQERVVVRLITIYDIPGHSAIEDLYDSCVWCSDSGLEIASYHLYHKPLRGMVIKKLHGGDELKRRPI